MSRIRYDVKVKYDENNNPVDILAADNKAMSVVTTKTDPTSGRIKNSFGEKTVIPLVPANRSIVQVRPAGKMTLSAATTITRHAALRVKGLQFAAYKLRLHNAYTSPIDYKCAFVSLSAAGDGLYNSATWDAPTFSGSSTGTVPAGTNTSPQFVEGVLDSDVVYNASAPLDANGYLYIGMRTYCAVANNTRFDFPADGSSAVIGVDGVQGAYKTGDFVTTISGLTSPTPLNSLPPVSLIAYSANQVRRIGLFGASTISGTGDTAGLGWGWDAGQQMSTDSYCVQFINDSMPGSKTAICLQRTLSRLAAGDVFDAAVMNVFSSNDLGDTDFETAAYLTRLKAQIAVFIDACYAKGVVPYLATFQSPSGYSGTRYTQLLAINAYARQVAATGVCGLFDLAGLLSDETQSTGAWKVPSQTDDGTHPNLSAKPYIVALAKSVFA